MYWWCPNSVDLPDRSETNGPFDNPNRNTSDSWALEKKTKTRNNQNDLMNYE